MQKSVQFIHSVRVTVIGDIKLKCRLHVVVSNLPHSVKNGCVAST